MSTYPSDSLPSLGHPACGDPWCNLDICHGSESHGIKKPWYMTQQPVLNTKNIIPNPIELMKVDGWVMEKYLESDIDSNMYHYCPSKQWKKLLSITEIRAGLCDDCCEIMPEEIVGAFMMHNWSMLQKYDADMKKYGADPFTSESTDTKIEVFR